MSAEHTPASLADFRHVTVVGVRVAEKATRAWRVECCKAMVVCSRTCMQKLLDRYISEHRQQAHSRKGRSSEQQVDAVWCLTEKAHLIHTTHPSCRKHLPALVPLFDTHDIDIDMQYGKRMR